MFLMVSGAGCFDVPLWCTSYALEGSPPARYSPDWGGETQTSPAPGRTRKAAWPYEAMPM